MQPLPRSRTEELPTSQTCPSYPQGVFRSLSGVSWGLLSPLPAAQVLHVEHSIAGGWGCLPTAHLIYHWSIPVVPLCEVNQDDSGSMGPWTGCLPSSGFCRGYAAALLRGPCCSAKLVHGVGRREQLGRQSQGLVTIDGPNLSWGSGSLPAVAQVDTVRAVGIGQHAAEAAPG